MAITRVTMICSAGVGITEGMLGRRCAEEERRGGEEERRGEGEKVPAKRDGGGGMVRVVFAN